jgi:hypothetical protein
MWSVNARVACVVPNSHRLITKVVLAKRRSTTRKRRGGRRRIKLEQKD